MRAIDFDLGKLNFPDGWAEKAEGLRKALVDEADPKKRSKLIDDNEIWKDVKAVLKALSNGKCWYTDSPQQGTDVDVDHYRPKKRVAELAGGLNPHQGYWWLAYELSNYRYSCIVANRRRRDVDTGNTGGKADFFPIFDEAHRANDPQTDYQNERPLLIDPCKPEEVALTTFKEDGEAMPRWGENEPYKHKKASKSIELYSLNHTDFVKARIALRDQIEEARQQAETFFNRLENGDADHEKAYAIAIKKLRNLQSPNAPYSGYCISLMKRYRNEGYLEGAFV